MSCMQEFGHLLVVGGLIPNIGDGILQWLSGKL